MNEIKLKVGGIYIDARGTAIEITEYRPGECNPYAGRIAGRNEAATYTFKENGAYSDIDGATSQYDLVKVVSEPQPQPQPQPNFVLGNTYRDGNGDLCKIVGHETGPNGEPLVRDDHGDIYHAYTGQWYPSMRYVPSDNPVTGKEFSLVPGAVVAEPEETKPEPPKDSGLVSLDKQYKTRRGEKAIVLHIIPAEYECTDYPVRGVVQNDKGEWVCQAWTLEGKCSIQGYNHSSDLVEVPPTKLFDVEVTSVIQVEASTAAEASEIAQTLVPGAIKISCE